MFAGADGAVAEAEDTVAVREGDTASATALMDDQGCESGEAAVEGAQPLSGDPEPCAHVLAV